MSNAAQSTLRIHEPSEELTSGTRRISDIATHFIRHAFSGVMRATQWLIAKRRAQLSTKRLQVCESVSLGEKRFIAIVQVDGQNFLIGGAATSVSMLGYLDQANQGKGFAEVLREQSGKN